ncbi:MAG: DUF5688 family protein [Lachnospiraceae bacterium]|nr:DUF5688 family protein [Lachnospiraceae bacterium]
MNEENEKNIIAAITDDMFVLPVSRRHEFYTKSFVCRQIGSAKFVAGGITQDEEGETRFAPFDKDVINLLGMYEEKIMNAAIGHMMDIAPLDVMEITQLMESMSPKGLEQLPAPDEVPGGKMIVVTTKNRKYGSVSILYPGALKNVSEEHFGGNGFYVLPCSIHEVICVPDDGEVCAAALQMMVIDINRSIVDPEDYLSDQVYFCDPKSDDVTVEET